MMMTMTILGQSPKLWCSQDDPNDLRPILRLVVENAKHTSKRRCRRRACSWGRDRRRPAGPAPCPRHGSWSGTWRQPDTGPDRAASETIRWPTDRCCTPSRTSSLHVQRRSRSRQVNEKNAWNETHTDCVLQGYTYAAFRGPGFGNFMYETREPSKACVPPPCHVSLPMRSRCANHNPNLPKCNQLLSDASKSDYNFWNYPVLKRTDKGWSKQHLLPFMALSKISYWEKHHATSLYMTVEIHYTAYGFYNGGSSVKK